MNLEWYRANYSSTATLLWVQLLAFVTSRKILPFLNQFNNFVTDLGHNKAQENAQDNIKRTLIDMQSNKYFFVLFDHCCKVTYPNIWTKKFNIALHMELSLLCLHKALISKKIVRLSGDLCQKVENIKSMYISNHLKLLSWCERPWSHIYVCVLPVIAPVLAQCSCHAVCRLSLDQT